MTTVQTTTAPSAAPLTSTTADAAPPVTAASSVGPPPAGPALPGGAATVSGKYHIKYVAYSPPTYNLNSRA